MQTGTQLVREVRIEARSQKWSERVRSEWTCIQFQSDIINWLINQQDSIYNVNHNWTSLFTRNEALIIELGAVIL